MPCRPWPTRETGSYLRHHLALAGRDALFSGDAVTLVQPDQPGYSRVVNNLALQALVAAFTADKAIADESLYPHGHRRSHPSD